MPVPATNRIEEPGVGEELLVALEADHDHDVEREEGEGEDEGEVAELDGLADFVRCFLFHVGKF